MKTILALIALCGSSLLAVGQAPQATSKPVPEAIAPTGDYETLRRATEFSMGAIGVSPKPSPNAEALKRILKTPDAAETFKKLTREGTLAGQLYGLWGLGILKDSSYASTAMRYRNSRFEVETLSADIVTKRPVFYVVQMIEGTAR